MSQLNEIRDLLRLEQTVAGRVISVSSGMARVSTAAGIKEVAVDGDLQPGDVVTVEAGLAIKRKNGAVGQIFSV